MLNDHIRDKTFEVRLGRKNKEDCCIEPNCGPAENICQPDYQPGIDPTDDRLMTRRLILGQWIFGAE